MKHNRKIKIKPGNKRLRENSRNSKKLNQQLKVLKINFVKLNNIIFITAVYGSFRFLASACLFLELIMIIILYK